MKNHWLAKNEGKKWHHITVNCFPQQMDVYCDGKFVEVKNFSKVLSAEEVQNLYSEAIVFNGDVTFNGNVVIEGDLEVKGNVTITDCLAIGV